MRTRFLLLPLLFARLAAAQTTSVSGVVHDSLARMPLAGAQVQLVAADSLGRFGATVASDSLGRFSIADVPPGKYTIGFFHPMLDSLGLEPTLRNLNVDGRGPIQVDLAIPSAERLRAAICTTRAGLDSGAVVVGVVRDARGRAPLAGVTVTAEWLEFVLSKGGMSRRLRQVTATTTPSGWFSICNTPAAGTIVLAANRTADSTDRIDLLVPTSRFLRHDLYLGPRSGSTESGRVSGSVVTAIAGTPLAGAQVSMSDGATVRANERGEWTLASASVGTRMIEVRAIGYYPERVAVNVVDGAAPIHVALATMKSVLDTVKVISTSRVARNLRDFDQRRRAYGMGHFITRDDIEKRNPINVTDMLRMVPGISSERRDGAIAILMRATFGSGLCSPAIYLDGSYLSDIGGGDIDDFVRPDEVIGIEVYAAPMIPPQFSNGMGMALGENGGCGSIAIWTRPIHGQSSRESLKWGAAAVLGAVGIGAAITALLQRH